MFADEKCLCVLPRILLKRWFCDVFQEVGERFSCGVIFCFVPFTAGYFLQVSSPVKPFYNSVSTSFRALSLVMMSDWWRSFAYPRRRLGRYWSSVSSVNLFLIGRRWCLNRCSKSSNVFFVPLTMGTCILDK